MAFVTNEAAVAEALVIIEDLKKSFQHMGRTLDVLKGIDLKIFPGQILAIVGFKNFHAIILPADGRLTKFHFWRR